MMNPNQQTIETFYAAFASHNPEGMTSCYHKDIVFRDPVFGILRGKEVSDMWHMLVERSKGGLEIGFFEIEADQNSGSAKWTATYIFSQSGRKVINQVNADFEFSDGLIIRHTDYFNISKWSRQALGIKGYLFGWTGFMQQQIRKQALLSLKKYQSKSHSRT